MGDRVSTGAAYGGGIFSILTALTLTEWGILVGIFTALATYYTSSYYQRKRNEREAAREQREAEIHALNVARLKAGLPQAVLLQLQPAQAEAD